MIFIPEEIFDKAAICIYTFHQCDARQYDMFYPEEPANSGLFLCFSGL